MRKPTTVSTTLKSDVIENLNRVKEEYMDEEDEFISQSDVIKNLLKEADNWIEPKPKKPKSGRKKRESRD